MTLSFCCATPAAAQEATKRDANLEKMMDNLSFDAKEVDKTPIPASSFDDVNIKVHWRLWKAVVEQGQGGADELSALAGAATSLGYRNQPVFAMAVLATARKQANPDVAEIMFEGARSLAPDLPYVHLARAEYFALNYPTHFGKWMGAYANGVSRARFWPDAAFPWGLKLSLALLVALFAGTFVFVLGQLVRYIGVLAYDSARAMPRGFSSHQTLILLLAAVIAPGVLTKSFLISLLALIALVSLVQRPHERLVTVVLFGLLAALPSLDTMFSRMATFSGSASQELLTAQYVRCDRKCLDAHPEWFESDDELVRYTAFLAAFRLGSRDDLKLVIDHIDDKKWTGETEGYANTLKGGALIARARPGKAVPVLVAAMKQAPGSPAPAFNLMRAQQMTEHPAEAERAMDDASHLDFDRVSYHLALERRDVNSYLMSDPLPIERFAAHHEASWDGTADTASETAPKPPVETIWALFAGEKVPLRHARGLGLLGMILALLTIPLGRRASTPCVKCGMARDPDDLRTTGHHIYCLPCFQTFVHGASLAYEDRVNNERVLRRRGSTQAWLRRIGSVLAPGLGHQLAGRALSGFAITSVLAFGAVILLRPMGPVRPMYELMSENWGGQQWIAGLLIAIAVCFAIGAAAFDVDPIEPPDERGR